MELVPGIYHVEKARGANSYLVINEDMALVIDTGLPGTARTIVEYAQGLGIKPEGVKYILLTHADIDHSGSTAELRKMTGARVAIHAGDAPALSGETKLKEVKGILSPHQEG